MDWRSCWSNLNIDNMWVLYATTIAIIWAHTLLLLEKVYQVKLKLFVFFEINHYLCKKQTLMEGALLC